ncbi:uncharacterized protein LOC102701625 [Oryza brachyantha]|uniref:uncharacterized protein LOC102701625 n=1 Tax=Oryza brachyantha TaxID=4533 RepID=UPI0003EAE074|nr:uncharacterized protein LOC102701625 [Oryza brachyantha]
MARRWWRIKLKEELEKQHDLKETYKARLESTQAYLRFCLEVAHEHGFLHLASSSNDDDESSSPPHDAGDEPATAAADDDNGDEEDGAEAPICDPHFAATRDLAVQHVWSVSPDEVRETLLIYCPSPLRCSTHEHRSYARGSLMTQHRGIYGAHIRGSLGYELTSANGCALEFFLADPSHGEAFFAQELDALSRQRDLHEETPMVVHRNLKPNNELLDGDLRVRVANFGHARFLPDGGTKVLT